jgi:hypothetical protein
MGDGGAAEPGVSASTVTRCKGTSGVYTRDYGYYCDEMEVKLEPKDPINRQKYAFFYDVNVIMPDQEHVSLHCSSILAGDCEGFPSYSESTSVVCSNFVVSGAYYKDCTASGNAPEGIGTYEALIHQDKVTIIGADWKREYVRSGNWPGSELKSRQISSQAQEPQPPAAASSSKDEEPIIDPHVIADARAGDAIAQYKLGYDYYLGKGISQDYIQAAIWWQKAAEQGNASAQNNLGVLYNSGRGVPQSYAEAYFWQNLAAARSNGQLQALFAKNRDNSAAKLSFFERLRVQKRAARWFAAHPAVQAQVPEPANVEQP